MVQKIVHYVWVGNKKTPMANAAIQNWKKTLSRDWVIKEWNEDNIPFQIPFIKYWYDKKQFSFISDYMRLYALEKYGGVYMDTDMFLNKEFPKKWLTKDICISRSTLYRYGMAFIIAKKNNLIIRKMREIYELDLFIKKNNHRWLFNAILITCVLHELYGRKNKNDDCFIGPLYIMKHDEAGLDFDNDNNIVKHFFGGSWKNGSNSQDEVCPGKYYYNEIKLYKNNWFIKFKFFLIAIFLRYKYKSMVSRDVYLNKKINELKAIL